MLAATQILEELKDPSSPETLLAALRAIKNDIIGHNQRKETWIRRKIVAYLKRILDTHKTSAKRRQDDRSDATQEDARLQAIIIVTSLAHGGPALIAPLRAGQLYVPLLHIISPAESSPKLVLAALRCLNAIADALTLECTGQHEESQEFLKLLYTDLPLSNLNLLLGQESQSPLIQQQIALTTELIAKTANNERRRKQIKISGIFQSLAVRLAGFVVASPQWRAQRGRSNRNQESGVVPANSDADLSSLLWAICVVIGDSRIRINLFCCFSVWSNVFPSQLDRDMYSWRAPIGANRSESSLTTFASQHTAYHPPLGFQNRQMKRSTSTDGFSSENANGFCKAEDDETPLVAWLIEVAKGTDKATRLTATWLIGLAFRALMVSYTKQRVISSFLVPMLVKMLESDEDLISTGSSRYSRDNSTYWFMQENVPRVLALFVQDNTHLQDSAAEAGAVKKLSLLLKQTFDPITASLLTPEWRPYDGEENSLDMNPVPSSVLGKEGLLPIVHHILQIRESYLVALSAIATTSDTYRQAIIDRGVLPFVIESLKPIDQRPGLRTAAENSKPGNPVSMLVAACSTVKTLSRSVSVLRTSLVDAGLAKPISNLLRHPDSDVKIAATDAASNIILPFSAMREDLTNGDILQVLCEHAHSTVSKLRISSLWALANFAAHADNESRVRLVQCLGASWLRQVIGNEDEDRQNHGSSDGRRNTSVEQVDHLNPMNFSRTFTKDFTRESPFGHKLEQLSDSPDVEMGDAHGQPRVPDMSSATYGLGVTSDDYFDAGSDERIAEIQAARDDLSAQEQALNVIRNLLVDASAAPKMIDFLFQEFGQDDLFHLFTTLLRPRNMDSFRGQDKQPGAPASKLVPPPSEIVSGVCYSLVNMAGGTPQHKSTILAYKDLLKLLVPLFTHPYPEIRVALVWLVLNLCWKVDGTDKEAAISRAKELERLGIIQKVREAKGADPDLDVRERAKQAITQIDDLMRE